MSQNRRSFLKNLGLTAAAAASPIELLLNGITSNLISRALAEEAQIEVGKYILIQQFGAPPRWMYDLFLSPYGSVENDVMPNGSVGSELIASGGRYTDTTYATHKVKGINAPLIWTQNVANSQGQAVPISKLMENMIVLQGIDALNPGHEPAAKLMNRPLTNFSIDGVLADHANLPFSGLGLGSVNLDFKSPKGKFMKNYSSGADFARLIPEAFEAGIGHVYSRNAKAIDDAVLKLNRGIASLKLGGRALSFDQQSAKKLMLGEIQKIHEAYPALLQKYENIISETVRLSQNLKGLTDLPVGKTGNRDDDVKYKMSSNLTVNDDDMRITIENSTINNLAKQFAVTEYVITNNLTSSTSLDVNNLRLQINGNGSGLTKDQHETGAIASVFYTTIYYRIISACTLGLVEGLKSKPYKGSNMFDHTVIRNSGEFGRHPRMDASGSDHSPWSSNCMLLSGMIKTPVVAGQIRKNGEDINQRQGSWGAAGLLKNGQTATTGHVISSIATMLDMKSPSPNNPSLLVKNESGEVEINEGYISKTEVV